MHEKVPFSSDDIDMVVADIVHWIVNNVVRLLEEAEEQAATLRNAAVALEELAHGVENGARLIGAQDVAQVAQATAEVAANVAHHAEKVRVAAVAALNLISAGHPNQPN